MKQSYDDLKKEFDIKVEKLQSTCKHKKLTSWMEEWWAPGHATGNVVRFCKICNKRVDRKIATIKVDNLNNR